MKIVSLKNIDHPEVEMLLQRKASPSVQVEKTVKTILDKVRKGGHEAVEEFAEKYDGLKGNLKVSASEILSQAKKCDDKVKKAINKAIINIRKFHIQQKESGWEMENGDGTILGQRIRPLRRIGIYVPGGKGIYPSTLLMAAVPAQVAGVKEIVAVTPCAGKIPPSIAYSMVRLGMKEIYKVGGAQAVGMLAYGTKKVQRVDKIVGPANIYASLAKKEVFGEVDIDMIAGPTEVLIMADESADPDWVAADLLSQAEHGSGYEAVVVITNSNKMAEWVLACVDEQVEASPKREILQKCLQKFGRIFVVKDWQIGRELADRIAPEHLELQMRNADKIAKKIENAGAIFIGGYSAEPIGDYMAGPNHVLPTNGSARFSSPLGTYDFYKRTSIIQYSQKSLRRDAKDVIALAEEEGFTHHAESVRKRMG